MATLPSKMVVHPGLILKEKLTGMGLSQRQLAFLVSRPYQAINEIIRGKKSITADTALQLEIALGIEAQYWLRLQADYDLCIARISRKLSNENSSHSN